MQSGAEHVQDGAERVQDGAPGKKSEAADNAHTPCVTDGAPDKTGCAAGSSDTQAPKSEVSDHDKKSAAPDTKGSAPRKENAFLRKKSAGIPRRTMLLAVVFWLCVWQLASMMIGQRLLLASPLQVCRALLALLPTAAFRQRVLFSAARIAGGFLLALAAGAACAVLAAVFRWAEALLRPLMLAVKAVPVASFIILALLWLRGTGGLSVFISFLMVLPVVYENVLAGIRAADDALLEMAAVFRVPLWRRVRALYAPAVLPYFRSACTVGLGLCWKSGVAAEVIGISGGSIGEALYNAKLLFATDELLAWTVVIVLLSLAFERLFLRLLSLAEKRLTGGAGHA